MARIFILNSPSHSHAIPQAIASHTFGTLALTEFPWWNIRAWHSIRQAIRAFAPDVLHCVGVQALRVAALLNRNRIPFMYSGVPIETMDRLTRRYAAKGIALLHTEVERAAFARFGLNAERIPLGIPDTNENLLPHPKNDSKVILFGGQLDETSDPRQAVWAFDCLKYALPTAQLVFLGRGPMESEIRKLSFGLGFDDYRFRFAAESERMVWQQRADLVWVTRPHGGAIEALEALAQGLPVIAMQTTELAEYASEGLTLVPAKDRIGLAASTLKLFSHPRSAVPMPRFPFRAMVEKYAAVYYALAGRAA